MDSRPNESETSYPQMDHPVKSKESEAQKDIRRLKKSCINLVGRAIIRVTSTLCLISKVEYYGCLVLYLYGKPKIAKMRVNSISGGTSFV